MEVFFANKILQPLSTAYVGDVDLKLRGAHLHTDEGFDIYSENYLLSSTTAKINNYNALFLTSKINNDSIFELESIKYPQQPIFTTPIKSGEYYLHINDDYATHDFVTESSQRTTFEIELSIDNIHCRIAHQRSFDRYYLHYNGAFYFSSEINLLFSQFKFILQDNTLYLFSKQSSTLYSIAADTINNTLVAIDSASWKQTGLNVNFYIQDVRGNLNTSWASYNTEDKNSLVVNPSKSITSLACNSIFYNNYTYITGGRIDTNFITLKNHHTHKNYSYRSNNLLLTDQPTPNLNIRDYTAMCTGVEQEQGSDSIALAYEFYNADYKFAADQYTVFITPPDIYPYTQLNINDTLFTRNGSIAGDTPYTADKIFFKDTRPKKSDGQYMCTWLSGGSPDGTSVWVDRYYIPERTSFAAALTSKSYFNYTSPVEAYLTADLAPSAYYDAPFVYPTLQSELAHTPQSIEDVLFGEYFFDKRSDMILLPDTEYIYQRIGNQYVDAIVAAITANLIQDGLSAKTAKGVNIVYDAATDEIEYNFDNNTYALVESFREINNTSQSTVSFWLDTDDWSRKFGHEILGNYNDRGFGVFNDQLVTPIIMVQDGRRVVYLNTNFDVIDSVYLSQTDLNPTIHTSTANSRGQIVRVDDIEGYFVKDLHRTDHLDFNSPIISTYTESLTTYSTDPFAGYDTQCGILQAETPTPLLLDNNITTDNVSITGIQLEPCKTNPGLTPSTNE